MNWVLDLHAQSAETNDLQSFALFLRNSLTPQLWEQFLQSDSTLSHIQSLRNSVQDAVKRIPKKIVKTTTSHIIHDDAEGLHKPVKKSRPKKNTIVVSEIPVSEIPVSEIPVSEIPVSENTIVVDNTGVQHYGVENLGVENLGVDSKPVKKSRPKKNTTIIAENTGVDNQVGDVVDSKPVKKSRPKKNTTIIAENAGVDNQVGDVVDSEIPVVDSEIPVVNSEIPVVDSEIPVVNSKPVKKSRPKNNTTIAENAGVDNQVGHGVESKPVNKSRPKKNTTVVVAENLTTVVGQDDFDEIQLQLVHLDGRDLFITT